MRRLFLFIVLLAFAVNHVNAQLNHVGFGAGPIEFPSVDKDLMGNPTGYTQTDGLAAYLSLGFDINDKLVTGGATLFIAGDSQISYGGRDVGSGAVGLVGFGDISLDKKGIFRLGAFAGLMGVQTYDARDLFKGTDAEGMGGFGSIQPELRETNIQPYGGLRLGIGPVEFQYAPASNMLTVGFRLYNGN